MSVRKEVSEYLEPGAFGDFIYLLLPLFEREFFLSNYRVVADWLHEPAIYETSS